MAWSFKKIHIFKFEFSVLIIFSVPLQGVNSWFSQQSLCLMQAVADPPQAPSSPQHSEQRGQSLETDFVLSSCPQGTNPAKGLQGAVHG